MNQQDHINLAHEQNFMLRRMGPRISAQDGDLTPEDPDVVFQWKFHATTLTLLWRTLRDTMLLHMFLQFSHHYTQTKSLV